MNVNQKINQNFKDIVLICLSASKIAPHIKASVFFEGHKNPTLCKTNWIKASKRMKRQYKLIGVGNYLRSKSFVN